MKMPPDLLNPEATRAANNSPFRVDSLERLMFVSAGEIDLFCARVLPGGGYGKRSFVCTLDEGDILFGLKPSDGFQFLAIGNQATELREVLAADFYARARSDAFLAEAESAMGKWVDRLSETSARRHRAAKINEHMRPGRVQVRPECNLLSPEQLLWVRCDSPALVLYNRDVLQSLQPLAAFPVTGRIWISSTERTEAFVLTTRELAETEDLQALVQGFNGYLSTVLTRERDAADREETGRIESRFTKDQERFEHTLSGIGSVLERGNQRPAGEPLAEDRLFACCQRIGEHMGQTFRLPTRDKRQEGGPNLQDIAQASHVRSREVKLEGKWWVADNGPMLAYWAGDTSGMQRGKPVALIPRGARGYLLYDPDERTHRRVDGRLADALYLTAHMFYRPLPERALSAGDLWRFTRRAIGLDAVTVLLTGMAGALLGLLVPVMTRAFFDRIIPDAATTQMFQVSMILLVSALVAGLYELTRAVAATRIEMKADSSLQAALWDKLLKLPASFYRRFTAGDLTARSMGINAIRQIISGTVASSMLGFVFSLVNLALMIHYSAKLARIALLLALVSIVLTLIVGLLQFKYTRSETGIQGEISGVLFQLIGGVAKLHIAAAEHRAFGVWAQKFTRQRRVAYRAGILSNIHGTVLALFPIGVSMILYARYVSLLQSQETAVSTGTLLAFIASYSAFQSALLGITQAAISSLAIFPLYERSKPILEAVPEVSEVKAHPGWLSGRVELNHVRFRYREEAPLVLDDVSVHVNPGEFVGIVGESGSGKSTLLRILLGFAAPESGTVYYDGQDLADLDVIEVRRQIGVVLQNAFVMAGSILDNIIGSANLTVDDAWEAARMVGLQEDIQRMPMGMQTLLPPGGWTLSGGQRQRLVIARAIVRRPKILLFDEATSALDNKTQATVTRSLEDLNVTRMVIAHRLSTIMNAGRIYVLKDGTVAETGTYQELMERRGVFSGLALRQIV